MPYHLARPPPQTKASMQKAHTYHVKHRVACSLNLQDRAFKDRQRDYPSQSHLLYKNHHRQDSFPANQL